METWCKWGYSTTHPYSCGPVSVVGIATGYGLEGPGIEFRWGARISALVQTGPGAHPASCTMSTGSFPGVKSGRSVTLTPHPLLVPWLWKGRAIPLLSLWAVRPVQSLSACTGRPLVFTLTLDTRWGEIQIHYTMALPLETGSHLDRRREGCIVLQAALSALPNVNIDWRLDIENFFFGILAFVKPLYDLYWWTSVNMLSRSEMGSGGRVWNPETGVVHQIHVERTDKK